MSEKDPEREEKAEVGEDVPQIADQSPEDVQVADTQPVEEATQESASLVPAAGWLTMQRGRCRYSNCNNTFAT